MAPRDYYNTGPHHRPNPAPSPYHGDSYNSGYDNSYEPSVVSSKPPTYVSQLPQTQQQHDQPGASAAYKSPFVTDFDDHVHPMQPTPMGSQQNFAHDTRYHGADGGDVSPVGGDDIPLQAHNKAGGPTAGIGPMDSSDHVYDASQQRRNTRHGEEAGKRGLHFGELGMFGSNKRRIPFMVYLFTIIQVGVFIGELVKSAQLTGSPIQTQPSVSPMLGPSQQVLINMGSRYAPCMRNQPGVQDSTIAINWVCPQSTTQDPEAAVNKCTLQQVCGFGNSVPNPLYQTPPGLKQDPAPNQWYRFIIPIFMHAGFVHIGFNLLLQLTIGKDIERAIGSIRFFLVYMSAGIFGFVMGGNFASPNTSSTGASGSLFGIIAITLLDLLYSWSDRRHPGRELIFIIIEILISLALGLLPGLDNFSHIGGFIVGICVGVSVLHSPNSLRRRIGEDHFGGPSYSGLGTPGVSSVAFPAFYRNPIGFFKGRKGLWWAWWILRAAFLVMVIAVFIVLLNSFYANTSSCSWCKYLSCVVSDLPATIFASAANFVSLAHGKQPVVCKRLFPDCGDEAAYAPLRLDRRCTRGSSVYQVQRTEA
ncbi:uncharacterized protein B0I36DRAFT_235755 [Microdochium trichocladiopsis]|uniref:Rhomboid-type serine protease n=1 Tax=Microdochium trichocladiopsis TaxID=1682393 RepID=A0A9P9BV16_9PEZI|nr:uncharacterized protein B0I36DRAFT_235755 [Microdochium trichocladiopsis]KAH7041561.1 hypothetical protein B0I36DRAFT_235755 [Microdochium trichocladiopsis]